MSKNHLALCKQYECSSSSEEEEEEEDTAMQQHCVTLNQSSMKAAELEAAALLKTGA